jgi:hypothetical protein
MTDRPIIFSAAMVNALGEGRKTQTRRLATSPLRKCEPGDRLWVRETCRAEELENGRDGVRYMAEQGWRVIPDTAEAAEEWVKLNHYHSKPDAPKRGAQVPAIHMPRWCSRMTLIIESVRIESLHAISEPDAIAEGIERIEDPRGVAWKSYETYPDGTPHPHASVPNASPVTSYRELWSSLHTKEGERWSDNPDVLVLTFRVVRGNIDQVPA